MPSENSDESRRIRTDLERYREMADLMHFGWWEYDMLKGQYTCSRNIKQLLGLKSKVFQMDDFVKLIREDYREEIRSAFLDTEHQDPEHQGLIYPIVTPKGEVWLRSVLDHVAKDEMGIWAFGTFNVLPSEHVAKIRSEKLFTDIFINIPVGEALFDMGGHFTDMNDAFMETFGLTSMDDVREYSLFDDPNWGEECRQVLTCNKYSFRQEYSFDIEHKFRTRRSGVAFMNCKLLRLFDEYDRCNGFMLICIEDTDRFIAMGRMHDFDNFFSLISNFAKIGYIKFNLMDYSGYAIQQWFKNVGETESTPLNQIIGVYKMVHPADRPRLLRFFEQVKSGVERGFIGEVRVRVPDEEGEKYKWVRSNLLLSKYRPEEGVIEIIGVNYDITQFKEIEKELIKAREKAETMDKLKSAFLANMSHEIRTPLNAIVGFSDLLGSTEDVSEREMYMSIVRENNELLLRLINDVLDFSKLEAGMVELSFSDVDINLLCSDIVQSLQLKVKKGVTLTFDSSEPVCHLMTDRNRLTQVLTNFINNAAKFTTRGNIRMGYQWVDNEHIRFYVVDTGIGISEENVKKIFKRFVKVDDFAQGTGLGLSICSSIIEQMGGKIGVNSKLGKGSEFWFILPYNRNKSLTIAELHPSTKPVNVSSKSVKQETERPEKKLLVLVAEDIDSNYIYLKAVLSKYELIRAKNGLDVVTLAQQHHPQLILMDVMMPILDGYEATRRIREFDQETPIIAVTASAFESDRRNALDAGCNGYVSKPYSAVTLEKEIGRLLKK